MLIYIIYVVFLLYVYITYSEYAADNSDNNWLCNQSLWSSNDKGNWSYYKNETNDICQYLSPREYEGSILWLGHNDKASLNWTNYRITVLLKLMDGFDYSIIFRTKDDNPLLDNGNKYILLFYHYQSYVKLVKSES